MSEAKPSLYETLGEALKEGLLADRKHGMVRIIKRFRENYINKCLIFNPFETVYTFSPHIPTSAYDVEEQLKRYAESITYDFSKYSESLEQPDGTYLYLNPKSVDHIHTIQVLECNEARFDEFTDEEKSVFLFRKKMQKFARFSTIAEYVEDQFVEFVKDMPEIFRCRSNRLYRSYLFKPRAFFDNASIETIMVLPADSLSALKSVIQQELMKLVRIELNKFKGPYKWGLLVVGPTEDKVDWGEYESNKNGIEITFNIAPA
jgi:hypothetical protein